MLITDELVTASILFAAGLLGSTFGFGFAGVCAIIIVLFGRSTYPLVALCVLAHVVLMVKIHKRPLVSLRTYFEPGVREYVVPGLFGVGVGLLMLFKMEESALKIALGLFLGVVALSALIRKQTSHESNAQHPVLAPVVGFLGGVTGGFAAFPLAVPAAYFKWTGQLRQSMHITQPFALACTGLSVALVMMHDYTLFVSIDLAKSLLYALPATAIGTYMGAYPFRKLSDFTHKVCSSVVMGFCALLLISQPGSAQSLTFSQSNDLKCALGQSDFCEPHLKNAKALPEDVRQGIYLRYVEMVVLKSVVTGHLSTSCISPLRLSELGITLSTEEDMRQDAKRGLDSLVQGLTDLNSLLSDEGFDVSGQEGLLKQISNPATKVIAIERSWPGVKNEIDGFVSMSCNQSNASVASHPS